MTQRLAIIWMIVAAMLLTRQSHAQNATAPPTAHTLDLNAFLDDPLATKKDLRSPIWMVRPGAGRRLLLIPIQLKAVSKKTEIDPGLFKPSSSRFLGWFLPKAKPLPKPKATQKPKEKKEEVKKPTKDRDDSKDNPPSEPIKPPVDPFALARKLYSDAPPRFSKRLWVDEQGNMHWEAPRVLLGGTPNNARSAYSIWIDRKKLKKPNKPKKATQRPRESNLDFRKRQLAEQRKYLDTLNEYNQINRYVSQLPTQFIERHPTLVWLVFDVPKVVKNMELRGNPPLPWTIAYQDLDTLKSRGRIKEKNTIEPLLRRLTSTNHLYDMRSAAMLMTMHKLQWVQPGSAMSKDVQKLLMSEDHFTRQMIIEGLTKNPKKTPASNELLRIAAQDKDIELALLALRGLIVLEKHQIAQDLIETSKSHPKPGTPKNKANETNPEILVAEKKAKAAKRLQWLIQRLVTTCQGVLAQPDGTPTDDILALYMEVDKLSIDARAPMISAIDVLKIHEDRVPALIAWLLDHVHDQELPRRWLDQQVLDNQNSKLVTQALHAIMADPPKNEPRRPQIAIDHPAHAILKLIGSKDPNTQKAAWASLGYFTIPMPGKKTPKNELEIERQRSQAIFEAFTKTAIHHPAPHPSAIRFLRSHGARGVALKQIQAILTSDVPPDTFRMLAMKTFLTGNSLDPLANTLDQATGPQRVSVAKLWYRSESALPNNEVVIPLALGLLHIQGKDKKRSAFIDWFTSEILENRRPHTSHWTNPRTVQEVEDLISLILTDDPVIARASASALLARAVWPKPKEIDALLTAAQEIKKASNEEAVRQGQMMAKWSQMRTQLVPEAMEKIPGKYEVYLRIAPPSPKHARKASNKDNEKITQPMLVDLGEITLQAEKAIFKSDDATFGGSININPTVTLMISTMQQIPKLKPDDVKIPPLSWPNLPMELLPDPGNSWVGTAELPSRHRIHLFLVKSE